MNRWLISSYTKSSTILFTYYLFLGHVMRYFRKPEAKTSCNIATKDIPADARNPSSLESEAGFVRELQAVQGYIELYPGLPYSKKKNFVRQPTEKKHWRLK